MEEKALKTLVMYAFCICEHRRWAMEKYHASPIKDGFGEEANPGCFYLNEAYENLIAVHPLSKVEFKGVVDKLVAEKRLWKNANPQYPLFKVAPPRLVSQLTPAELVEIEAVHGPMPKSDQSMVGKVMTLDMQTGESHEATPEERAEFEREQERWKKMTPDERKAEREKAREKAQAEWRPLPDSFPHPDRGFYEK